MAVKKNVKKASKAAAKKVIKKVSEKALNRLSNSDLVKHIAKTHNIPANKANAIIKDIFSFIAINIKKGKSYSQVGFGTFRKTRSRARKGTNPKTGRTY